MTVNSLSDSVYTDFQGLSQLQYQAASNDPKAMREVGKHFEALFIQMMLKSMRQATPSDPILGGKDEELYRDLFDKQISETMAARGQLGIADMIVGQLKRNFHAQASSHSGENQASAQPAASPQQSTAGSSGPVSAADKVSYASPGDFVKDVWPYAQRAAAQLKVDPQVLVAQAALETGWGGSIISHPDGRSSNNLFGIKAGPGWQKRTASVPTLEYRDGIAVKQRAVFRAYDSLAESFQDYVHYLQNNPRYQAALSHAGNPRQFSAALQEAGYATDPRYAEKINNVLGGDTLAAALADLKVNAPDPIG